MPWDRSTPTDPKYRSKEHRDERAKWQRQLERDGYLICMQPVCVMTTRTIRVGDRWHLGHDDLGVHYIGPTHPLCNVKDGARRARAKQSAPKRWAL